MITRTRVVRAIDEAEAAYENCWNLIRKMKFAQFNETFAAEFFEFQPVLCQGMMQLERLYSQIAQEKRSLIRRKQALSARWFGRRMKTLDAHADSLTQMLSIGKVIGDGFAWIFYQHEPELLDEHHKHQRTFHLPTGLGGLGELEFIKNRVVPPQLAKHLIIYHGTTSYLRLGDVSFIDMTSRKVVAIGELKTTKLDDDHISVTVVLLGKERLRETLGPKPPPSPDPQRAPRLSPEIVQRLRQQVSNIHSAFTNSQKRPDRELVHHSKRTYIEDLIALANTINAAAASYRKAGDGMLLVGLKFKESKLSSRLCAPSRFKTNRLLKHFGKEVSAIVDEARHDNSAIVGSLVYTAGSEYSLMQGMTPFLWWPIDVDFMRSVLFQEVVVFNVFNPIHLLKRLETLGFTVHRDGKSRDYRITKRDGDKVLELVALPFYFSMIQKYLFSEDTVIEIIEKVLEQIHTTNFDRDALIQFNFRQIL
jgi:hypothetical protein